MKAKDLTLKVVNETEEGKFEIKEFKPYMAYESFVGCILGDAEILRPTGLKDKNGKQIYEGDIVRDLIDYSIHKVIYLEKHWYGYVFLNINTEECNNLFEFDEVEVIGNIYENPELLSSQK